MLTVQVASKWVFWSAGAVSSAVFLLACPADSPHCVRLSSYEIQGPIKAGGDPDLISIAQPESGVFELSTAGDLAMVRRLLLPEADDWGPLAAVDGTASLLRFSQGSSLLANAAVIDDDAPDLAVHDDRGPLLDISREYNVPFEIKSRTPSGYCREPIPRSHPEVMSAVATIETDDGGIEAASGQKVRIKVDGLTFDTICFACTTDFALFFTMRIDGE